MAMKPAYGELPIHPLIEGLAVGLEDPGRFNLSDANDAAARAAQTPPPPPPHVPPGLTAAPTSAVDAFARPRRAEVVMFAGYLGPAVDDPVVKWGGKFRTWRLLYQDAKAMSWLLVPVDAIVLFNRVEDRRAAFRLRDVIWVLADAPVRQGTVQESEEARFLVGTFTRAGDLHASLLDASTAPAGSGILCAPTPECCRHGTG
jgi:hypothetical protein